MNATNREEIWCEHCKSTIVGAHLAGCGEAPLEIVPKELEQPPRLSQEPDPKQDGRKKENPKHPRRTSITIRLTENDPEVDTMKALSHAMDYCIERGSLNQRQIDRIGSWFVDKYLDEIHL